MAWNLMTLQGHRGAPQDPGNTLGRGERGCFWTWFWDHRGWNLCLILFWNVNIRHQGPWTLKPGSQTLNTVEHWKAEVTFAAGHPRGRRIFALHFGLQDIRKPSFQSLPNVECGPQIRSLCRGHHRRLFVAALPSQFLKVQNQIFALTSRKASSLQRVWTTSFDCSPS